MSVQTVVSYVGLSSTEPLYRYWPIVHVEVVPAYASTDKELSMFMYACILITDDAIFSVTAC